MAAVWWCWLLAAGCLVLPSGAQEAYEQLNDTYKKGVDLAVEKLNSHVGINHHFLFFKSLSQSDIQPGFDVSYIYHRFYLKATRCPRGTVDTSNCPFRNDRVSTDRSPLQTRRTGFGLWRMKDNPGWSGLCVCVCVLFGSRFVQPLMDCAVCYKTFAGAVETTPKPYLHCVRKPTLTQEMRVVRVNHCNQMSYSNGAPTLLASTGD
ncbi:hypothetical protein NHX12_021214 [Muraenolepis orangiensis]|uniref:Retinoic acid receptor responder protein 2 n=1 Tax=Muraenolepis orangiensis TaxID=630683 RepID=A0A9Q0ERS7_9TELE|nr:hypothetical protein NHX12_021214 [Muraenolepis orangiensis]